MRYCQLDIPREFTKTTKYSYYVIGTFMYDYLFGNITDIFRNFCQRNCDVHDYESRYVNDFYDMDDLILGNLVWKLQERICGTLTKNSQSV